MKYVWVISGTAICMAVLSYFVYTKSYDFGYAEGSSAVEQKWQTVVQQYRSQIDEQKSHILQVEDQMAVKSREFENLREELSALSKENAKWKKMNEDSQKEAFSINTVDQLNNVLSH